MPCANTSPNFHPVRCSTPQPDVFLTLAHYGFHNNPGCFLQKKQKHVFFQSPNWLPIRFPTNFHSVLQTSTKWKCCASRARSTEGSCHVGPPTSAEKRSSVAVNSNSPTKSDLRYKVMGLLRGLYRPDSCVCFFCIHPKKPFIPNFYQKKKISCLASYQSSNCVCNKNFSIHLSNVSIYHVFFNKCVF